MTRNELQVESLESDIEDVSGRMCDKTVTFRSLRFTRFTGFSDADGREQETRKSRTRKLELRIYQSSRWFSSHRGAEIKDKVQHLICKLDWGFRIIPKVEQGCCERFENDSTSEAFPMKSHRKLFTNFSLPSLNVLTSTKLFHALRSPLIEFR